MTIGEKLLNLTIEYQASLTAREWTHASGDAPAGREPSAIGAEYESTMRELLS